MTTLNDRKRSSGWSRRAVLGTALAATALFGAMAPATTAFGQDYPNRPVRIIVPFGPGGLADITMRLAAEKLTEILGQQVIVENHPGAGGVAAANELLKSQPDGHDLVVMSNGTTIAVSLFNDLGYDPQTQFAPISTLAWFDLGLFVNPDSAYQSINDVIEKAKADPGSVNIASINPGSTQNLAAEYFRSVTGIEATIIPYRTSPDVLAALIRGEVDLAVESPTAFTGAINDGQAKLLAVTGNVRNPAYPDVPTAIEAGVEGYDVSGWNALYALGGTPQETIDKLNAALVEITQMADIQARFAELGTNARALTPQEMAEQFEVDRARWDKVIEDAGIERQ